MNIIYRSVGVIPEERCVICHEDLSNDGSEVVDHSDPHGEVNIHPIHKKCIRKWVAVRPTCPTCRGSVKLKSLWSWNELVTHEVQIVAQDALSGAVAGAMLSEGRAVRAMNVINTELALPAIFTTLARRLITSEFQTATAIRMIGGLTIAGVASTLSTPVAIGLGGITGAAGGIMQRRGYI
ncbi:hypothetical protein SCG7086_CG_00040 [Chlamydiales bacterium SCGC AG-110-P3]|nr:hypothetical protein SCG7086_CG_00040 [Chlamydiales bacterium SCGC AG-110-P3]